MKSCDTLGVYGTLAWTLMAALQDVCMGKVVKGAISTVLPFNEINPVFIEKNI